MIERVITWECNPNPEIKFKAQREAPDNDRFNTHEYNQSQGKKYVLRVYSNLKIELKELKKTIGNEGFHKPE